MIDRSARVAFRFDGVAYEGHPGDTLASALVANGVRLVGRSFKYHRPRGLLAAGPEEPNGLVELRDGARREPNTRATVVELHDGLTATSQNRWPSLRLDLMGINQVAAPLLGAGVLLQDLHVAAGLLGEAVRAADPPGRRPRPGSGRPPIPTATRRPPRIATCWSSAAVRRA